MQEQRFTEKDWKLFRNKISDWQEAYMDKLNREYIAILSEEAYFPMLSYNGCQTKRNSDKILFMAFINCYILFPHVTNPHKGKNKGTRCLVDICSVPTEAERRQEKPVTYKKNLRL